MNNKIRYTDLKDFNNIGDYDFYGIVYDATYPSIDERNINYICAVKLIGPRINWLTNPENLLDETINVIIKSNNIKEIPIFSQIGVIMRVHRGVYRPKKRKNVYLNLTNIVKIKSSWVLFESKFISINLDNYYNEGYKAISSLTTKFSFDNIDIQIIEYLRKWSRNYFFDKSALLYPKTILLKERNSIKNNENDINIIIIAKFEKTDINNNNLKLTEQLENNENNEKIILRVIDESDICDLIVKKNDYNNINIGDIVRIRSIKYSLENKYDYIIYKYIIEILLN